MPKDILDRFQLKDGDMIDISYNQTQIMIEPHRKAYVCAVTGKISTEVIKIGESWFSKDGIKQLMKYMDQ